MTIATYDMEAEICSLAVTEASAVLSFMGVNGERISVTMPRVMLDTLAGEIAGVRTQSRRWTP